MKQTECADLRETKVKGSQMGHMASVRDYYGVPAYRGASVAYTWPVPRRTGIILSAKEHKLWIRFDDTGERIGPFHPTWEIEYL